MSPKNIPVHRLEESARFIGVEGIRPRKRDVVNGVHRHDFFEIFLFFQGQGDHMIDLNIYAFKAPCVHLVAPGQVHRLSRSAKTEGAVVMFKQDVDFGLLNGARDTLFRPAHEPHYELIEEQVEELKVLVSSVEQELDNNEDLLAATFLGILLGKCSTWMKSDPKIPADKGDGDVVTRFQRMVEAHYTTRTKVSEYVDDLYVSAGHLNELTKARTGMSCGQLILQRRILEAKRLLLHSNLAVKEIAYALGMDDPAYFNRVFRKSVGVPPATFRNTIREKYN